LRRFIDLQLRDPGDYKELEAMLGLASRLGFHSVAISSKKPPMEELRKLASGIGLDIAGRINLRPRNANELNTVLREERKRFEIVAVECRSKLVARQATKDLRVDIISFPSELTSRRTRFDLQEASLISDSNCAYEFNLSDLLEVNKNKRHLKIAMIRREIANAVQEGIPVVASSGASSVLGLRDPRGLASVLSLFDLGEEDALDAVSGNPMEILRRNREKLAPSFMYPGVRVV
jgi:RNase P/RNase MRP subunit p30